MPAKKSAPKKSASKRSASKTSSRSRGKAKVEKVMHEYKHGQLKSGSGRKVKNPKQAIAIGLSEARRAGANIPDKRSAASKRKSSSSAARKKTAKRKTGTSRKTSTARRKS